MVFEPKTNKQLNNAVDSWCNNKKKALEKYGAINTWNTSNITSMKNLFNNKINFNDNISNWDTSRVTNMEDMFCGCNSFNQSLNNWNTINVTNMRNMFNGCSSYSYPLFSWTNYDIILNTQIFDKAINKKSFKAKSISIY